MEREKRIHFYTSSTGKYRVACDLFRHGFWSVVNGGVLARLGRLEPPDFNENHRLFNPEVFILDKARRLLSALRENGMYDDIHSDEVNLLHDFMATAKVLGLDSSHVFLNKPIDGVDPLVWFCEKMNELREICGGGVVELSFRNLALLFKSESLSFDWRFRYGWHMETVRVVLSPDMLDLMCDMDKLRKLDERWNLSNARAAGGVNLSTNLLPMLVHLASLERDDGLYVSVHHTIGVEGGSRRKGEGSVLHGLGIDDKRDVSGEVLDFLERFAHGFSIELVAGLIPIYEKLINGGGKVMVV